MLNIKNRRECFFDDFLIDTEKTTAKRILHHPVKRERVLLHDAPWEGDGCTYHHIFFDPRWHGVKGDYPNGTYRMYYLGYHGGEFCEFWNKDQLEGGFRICYAESGDGIHFEKPDLGICTYGGSTHNNLILDKTIHPESCQLYVFYDENPDCPESERYKGITAWDLPKVPGKRNEFRLFTMLSADGIHFRFGEMITNKGYFDSLNIMMWDAEEKLYRLYARGMRIKGMSAEESASLGWDAIGGKIADPSVKAYREVFYFESRDYKTWSDPVCLSYGDEDEYHMYTNGISRYVRAPHIYIGFPTRYNERTEWTKSYDALCGKEKRWKRYQSANPRSGLAVTDCGFMTSRDGLHFNRFKAAFMRPGPEHPNGWLYGDCYPTPIPMITKSQIPGADDELSFYSADGHCLGNPAALYRYAIRMDGFASLHAEEEETVVTKPFIYEGESLCANISTSAFGHLYFTLTCEGESAQSCEIFGDSIDKRIPFPDDAVKRFSGKEVVLQIKLYDADIYSIIFR
ncbi:MAG: hypothetical protein J6J66_04910 [Clostridia bacterium]|nr:hypothetical protein [Clostridia bacterium]